MAERREGFSSGEKGPDGQPKAIEFLATEKGLIANTPEGRDFSNEVVEAGRDMDFQTISATLQREVILGLTREVNRRIENVAWMENDPKTEEMYPGLLDLVAGRLHEEQEELHAANALRLKTALGEPLSLGELSRLLTYVKTDGNDPKRWAEEIFVRRELRKKKEEGEGGKE